VELLDDPAAEPAAVRESLRNIARANRWFGGCDAVRIGLHRLLVRTPTPRAGPLTLLDVGTGAGDLPRMAVQWAARRGIHLRAIGLERHPAAARLARQGGLATFIGDAATLPLAGRSVDLVLVSQLLHHFAPESIVRLLRECNRVARVGVIVADLRRSRLAALGWRFTGPLLRFDRHTVADGITSLRRGFTARSLGALLDAAGIRGSVSTHRGVRLLAVWRPAT
jgi:SAM-dependent methyltransferase